MLEFLGATHFGLYHSVLRFGSVQTLPVCGPDDLLIRVAYAELNPVDLQKLQGAGNKEGQPVPVMPDNSCLPFIVGYGGSGTVHAVGSNCGSPDFSWTIGQRVAFLGDPSRPGGYASHILVDRRLVARVPSLVTLQQAATVPLAGCTSFESLVKLGLLSPLPSSLNQPNNFHSDSSRSHDQRQKTLLVVGGAGGLGSWTVQLARAAWPPEKLRIVATASSEASRTWCQKLGADNAIPHDGILSELPRSSVDYILCLTEPTPTIWHALSEVVRPYGTICLVVAGKSIQSLDMGFLFFKAVTVTMETVFSSIRTQFEYIRPSDEMEEILRRMETGAVKAPLSPQLPSLAGADDWKDCLTLSSSHTNEHPRRIGILEQLASGHTMGKLVMKIGGEQ